MVICGVTCTNLVLVRIWKKINNDTRRKEVAIGEVAAYLCLTLIIKELEISVEHDWVVKTLNIIFSVILPSPTGYVLTSSSLLMRGLFYKFLLSDQ